MKRTVAEYSLLAGAFAMLTGALLKLLQTPPMIIGGAVLCVTLMVLLLMIFIRHAKEQL